MVSKESALLGVDVGGTFTDFVLLRGGEMAIYKLPTTVPDPSEGFLAGLRDLGLGPEAEICHGTTVATNVLLEGKGAKTALVTTSGCGDVLEIGRQTRSELYRLAPRRPKPLVPAEGRFEVEERIDSSGQVLQPLNVSQAQEAIHKLLEVGYEALAICFLFSFLRPDHEQQFRELLQRELAQRRRTLAVSLSSEVLPEHREFERTSTTVVNAYVTPLVQQYLERLEGGLGRPFRVMQSNGGTLSSTAARHIPVHTIGSGPAAGVAGAFPLARLAGWSHIITFDMGGTSTDVCLCPGEIPFTSEALVGGYPVRTPMIDVHSVGAGGGSIARLDPGGALVVGPHSAGADPGPLCYGRGTAITVTDANLVLGRLDPRSFLGGRMALDVERPWAYLRALGDQMGLSAQEAARGIVRVANANMERALRTISVERGFDPRHFVLVAFGGAGPLHATDLATSLRIPHVLVPRYPGVLSALGLLLSDVVKDYTQTVMLPFLPDHIPSLAEPLARLETQGWAAMRAEGFAPEGIVAQISFDLRYVGQAYELTVPLAHREEWQGQPEAVALRFHRLHQQRFGHSHPGAALEVVNLRVRMIGKTAKPLLHPQDPCGGNPRRALLGERPVLFDRPRQTPLYDRAHLIPGDRVTGPAVILQEDTTTLVPPGWQGTVDPWQNLLLSP